MTVNLRIHMISALACLPLMACNNDIFVEDSSPSQNEVEIEGDGGTCSIEIKTKALKDIYVSSGDSYNTQTTYYDRQGNPLEDNYTITELGSINYSSMWVLLDVDIDGNRLTIRSTENSSRTEQNIYISLDYGHVVENIKVNMLPGKPMETEYLIFAENHLNVTPISKIESTAQSMHNNTSITQRIEFHPYLEKEGIALLDHENPQINSLEVKTSLPTYINGRWIMDDGEQHAMSLGQSHRYFPKGLQRDLTVSVEVAPYTNLRAVCGVEYSSITVPFFASFINPVSGRTFLETGVCTVSEPVGYRIHTEEYE